MREFIYTKHSQVRSQQRGIPPLIQEWLLDFGEELFDHHGAITYFFTRKSRRNLERTYGREAIRRFHEWFNSYLVISLDDGALVTVGKRFKKLNH